MVLQLEHLQQSSVATVARVYVNAAAVFHSFSIESSFSSDAKRSLEKFLLCRVVLQHSPSVLTLCVNAVLLSGLRSICVALNRTELTSNSFQSRLNVFCWNYSIVLCIK